jgi:hypothetical protein
MLEKRPFLTVLQALVLVSVLLVLIGCGEEEGRAARATVDQAADDAESFAHGFCGAIILAPLCLGASMVVHRPRRH